jgi:MoaA/NifB/PqqE/SkfB family radical SAM enzyme
MDFPQVISFTLTNSCNLRCQMCGQWSEEGYVRCGNGVPAADSVANADGFGHPPAQFKQEMTLADWKRLVDELAAQRISALLLRGGEPFLFPGIIELLEYIHEKGIFISIDTNATRLAQFAEAIARIGKIHLTISLDGPEAIHDKVRGVKGTFARVREGLVKLREWETRIGKPISKSFNFTVMPTSLRGLGAMPDTARSLGLSTIAIVPYYYFPQAVGEQYARELAELDCSAYSWVGFHHETSGVDFALFQKQYRQYLASLDGILDYPYMAFSEEEYRVWFADAVTPVGQTHCSNIERLIDIQPNGDANFCVDFIDFAFGNVRESSIAAVWNSPRAEEFRAYRREKPLAVCHRCGAKYMSEMQE